MKPLILTFLLATGLCAQHGTQQIMVSLSGAATGGISKVQNCSSFQPSSVSSVACTLSATGAGNLLVVTIYASAGVTSLSDSASSVYTQIFSNQVHGHFNQYYLQNTPSGITSVTGMVGFGFSSIDVTEWSGLATSGTFDKSSSLDNGFISGASTGAAANSGTTLATTTATELVYGSCINGSSATSTTWGIGAGYTVVQNIGGAASIVSEYKTVSSTGTQQATVTHTDSVSEVVCGVATFK